jgi:osmotically inducible lipoprotein OsmB
MRKSRILVITLVISSFALGGCSGMTKRQQQTATGAAIGGVAGALLTHGSVIGTVGGAAIGGVIGHEIDRITR